MPHGLRYPTVAVSRLALREGHAKKPIYTMHKWWARRLGTVFRMLLIAETAPPDADEAELWRRFYDAHTLPDGYTVLDPFLGGGTTLVEAAKQGARCVGIDIDPVACFVTRMELTPVDPQALQRRFQEIDEAVGERVRAFYRSRVDGEPVDVIYWFWVDRVACPSCGKRHDGHPTYQVAHYRETGRQIVVCPGCGKLGEREMGRRRFRCGHCHATTDLERPPVRLGKFHCPGCGHVRALHELYRAGRVTQRLFAQEYLTADGKRGFAPTGRSDDRLYREAAALFADQKDAWPIPDAEIPSEGRSDSRPLLYGYTHYRQLFNPRQLACLGMIAEEVRRTPDRSVRLALALAFSQCLASNNMFCGYAFGYRRLTPLFSVHSYRKIARPVEGNVWGLPAGRGSFRNAVRNVLEGQDYLREPFEYRYRGTTPLRVPVACPGGPARIVVLNRSSEDIAPVPTGSVDLVLTDPPYFDNLSYSELSDFYHVWLRRLLGKDYPGHDREHTPLGESMFAGRRGADDGRARYTETLTRAFRECHRVSREGAPLIFTYHHRSPQAWASVGSALLTAGFRIEEVFPVRSEGKSGLHSYAGSIKWDSVLRCRKAEPIESGEVTAAAVTEAAASARRGAAAWRKQLTAARLAFGPADLGSLAMSLLLEEFSDRGLPSTHLLGALSRVGISGKLGKATQKSR